MMLQNAMSADTTDTAAHTDLAGHVAIREAVSALMTPCNIPMAPAPLTEGVRLRDVLVLATTSNHAVELLNVAETSVTQCNLAARRV